MTVNIYKNSEIQYVDTKMLNVTPTTNNKVVSLFSGSGGLDIGLERAGFETVACVEIDKNCRETLNTNRPDWNLLENCFESEIGDIKSITGQSILEEIGLQKGEVGIVCGGAPCQPFSNIGKKEGKNDKVNGDLFLEFVRIVSEVMPNAFIFENVAGIAQKRHSDVIEYMEKKCTEIGYTVSGKILIAADYGVGQKRARFFLIGLKGKDQPYFPLPTHAESSKLWEKFSAKLDPIPSPSFKKWVTLEDIFNGMPMNNNINNVQMNISDKVKNRMKYIGPGQNFKVLPMELRPNCWKTGKHAGHDTFGRMELNKPSPTIRTAAYNPSKGKYIHPTENRGMNLAELAAIQGFPFDWQFKTSGRDRVTLVSGGKQIGNAVPPLLAEEIGKALAAKLFQ